MLLPSARWLYWALVLAPALPYVVLNLSYRRIVRRKIVEATGRLTQKTKKAYATAFGDPDVQTSLGKFYHWTTYVAPLVLTSSVAAAFTSVALAKAGVSLPGLPADVVRLMATTYSCVIAGTLGAYLFGLDDLVRRHASADLSSSALHTTWVRIAMTAGIGAVIGSTGLTAAVSIPLAFAVGTLPISAMWAFVRQKANLQIDEGRYWESDLYLIQGLTKSARDRLIAEDIDSVERLAFADPIRLLFRTNIEWNVLLDVVDQALLVNYVGAKIAALRDLGIRGSIEMAELIERDRSENSVWEIEHAKRMLSAIGAVLGHDEDAAYNLSYQLAWDPVVLFIFENYGASYAELGKDKKAVAKDVVTDQPLPRFIKWLWTTRKGTTVSPPATASSPAPVSPPAPRSSSANPT
jgi:hypothetical protein